MHINLPDKIGETLAPLNTTQKGLIFCALLCHANGEDTEYYEKDMAPETKMAFSFITMWNETQKEKFQARRVKYNQENRTASV